ncbi:TadE/TadG family type IV pilus assembly protein [Novosphingobium album (ex Hu et al. 2023)]|uniref:Pilus assembly protein n=1 Tax=Novosphingobium album (ex Hu et al. 2023) TaxID=2930093 RepID=A0ABT0B340_9SPHN|nr:TadE/TadG family type IV pilus assembly protein [Novosphingobium album (ex Hu et al. 2023)]MCJ2179455.1 pilus assembly protein [Novosphingobium album (ex Hu et al. 2023)]
MAAWSTTALGHKMAALRKARDGAAIVEFALAAPVLIMLLIGIFDLGYMVYAKSILNGAIQHAARSSSLETADTSAADAYISSVMKEVLPGAQVTMTRKSYYDFTDIARPESWNDANNNGTCDNDEAYTDENGNGQWDADVAKSGNGGADDVVIYTVTVTYTPLFPNPFIEGTSASRTLSASTVKKNQPFSSQTSYGSSAGVCS